ncbi:MAG: SDR family oxidoreductase [Algiphilus sp.]|uniref:SDR family oxidoreductase n=1 Tax=Algiphilus sp. TaxID=1872431 RepID=UPI001CA76725|nr:SDR family oxidoreductase [Algiphilus sp.]MBY8966126.1 SDR family oxidoreductase [Algiphilus acroporae]MCI5102866.1 SDR family oxidoreductase [Algiphilus sp.]
MGYRSVLAPHLFDGQVVVITGGGSGIGRCTAHEIASLGGHVVITGRKQEKLDATAAEIREDGGAVSTLAFDIRDEEAVTAAVREVLEAHGRIDGLVNNAGGQYPTPLELIKKKGWEAVVANNLTGGFLMARECYVQTMKANGGAIVNMIADMWNGMPGMGHSGAARAGMLNFTETAATEWGVAGVRVNAVAPGYIASSGMDHYDPTFAKEVIPRLSKLAPLQRMGEEAEVSSAICWLLSEGAAFVTGTCIKIDGGSSLGAKAFPLQEHDRSKPYMGFHRARRPKAID